MKWKDELRIQAEKYHIVGAWVAIILDPIWAVQDYLEMPEYFLPFLIFRLSVAGISLVVLLAKKSFNISPEWFIFVPFLGIAIQNAYMYSVMPVEIIQKHTFAYIALFIGAGMLILWKPIYTIMIVGINILANVVFFYFNSTVAISDMLINGGFLTLTVSIFTILLIQTRYKLTLNEIKARLALEESKKEIEKQKETIEHVYGEVQASINYAERIQSALLAGDESWEKIGKERFILFKPRDVVSGDFYWAFSNDELAIWAAADCTGHGVPGAFMSMLGIGFLNEIVAEGGETNAAQILNQLRRKIIKSFEQKGNEQRKDGMDISLCVLEKKSNVLHFSGAYNPLFIVRNNNYNFPEEFDKNEVGEEHTLYEFKANKMPIGKHIKDDIPFAAKSIQLLESDTIYNFSDGFQDQFGGPNGEKYMIKKMKHYLLSIQNENLEKQKELLNTEFVNWMKEGKTEQIDDVCIVGIKI